jgi:polyhydroxyalkanoate synthase
MATPADTPPTPPGLEQWADLLLRAQEAAMTSGLAMLGGTSGGGRPAVPGIDDAAALAGADAVWRDGLDWWQRLFGPLPEERPEHARDKRFKAAAWRDNPYFDWLRRSYFATADRMLAGVDALEGVEPRQKERLRFATQVLVDAMSPANFPLTNPEVIERAVETRGESLAAGLRNLMADLTKGQMTHVAPGAFEVGRNLATTPGKVVKRTALYELIQYAPTTDTVLGLPLVIFPPWINRFYILDLAPEKSFIRWCVDQGITVFTVSWKSADATMKDVVWDDYVSAQVEAIDTARALLDQARAHAIGYCVAGTTLAATLALLSAREEADRVASATFFTAQVDFSAAGDLLHFVGDEQLALVESLSGEGFLDGRYMAAVFNLLRGRDLIWNYHTGNYLLGQDYSSFDLLHWNGDTTNLPAKWHGSYLRDLYRDNLLVKPGAMSVDGTPIDLRRVETPTYVQAGREDHIAPAESVWALTQLFSGAIRFVLAGSGHIAGVMNHPSTGKYQYWTNPAAPATFTEFVAGATETKGSWWPDWLGWLRGHEPATVKATGARIPGEGSLPALGDAPGDYVRAR